MADDNVDLAAPAGMVATDDIAGKLYQRIKAGWGADGTWAETATAMPFPVQVRSSAGVEATFQALVAHDGIDAGDPVKIGGYSSATAPADTSGNGDRVNAWFLRNGALVTSMFGGSVAHDAVDSGGGGPLKIGGYASAAAPTDVSGDADRVNAWFLRNGALATAVHGGTIAHGAADSGNPVKVGFKATTSLAGITLAADAQRSNGYSGIDGVQIVRPHCNLEDIVSAVVACTSGANTSIIPALGSGIRFYLTSVVLWNNGTTAGSCLITDNTGGTTMVKLPFPGSSGTVFNPAVPIRFSANTPVFADPSGSDTIDVTIIGFRSKV